MLAVFWSWKTSEDRSLAVVSPVFCHQCETPLVSVEISPALCTIGTAQVLE